MYASMPSMPALLPNRINKGYNYYVGCDRQFKVYGHVRAGFEPVKEMFEANFRRGKEENAQLCVYVNGEVVVDLWGGTDEQSNGSTLYPIFSSSKSITAIVIGMLVDRGHLDYSTKISEYWPEFTGDLKETATLADLMRHELGLQNFSTSIPAEDLVPEKIKCNYVGDIIEKEVPKSAPGTDRDYHFFTRGWIANEIVRRADPQGRTIGEFIRDEINPQLDTDVYIGVPENKRKQMGKLTIRNPVEIAHKAVTGTDDDFNPRFMLTMVAGLVFSMINSKEPAPASPIEDLPLYRIDKLVELFNTKPEIEIPSANATCNARGLAKLGAVMTQHGKLGKATLMSTKGWKSLHSNPTEKVIFNTFPTRFTQGGVNIYSYAEPEKEPETEQEKQQNKLFQDLGGFVGWMGLGGSIFQWHPRRQISFAYIPSQLDWTDFTNAKGMKLQQCVVQCAQRVEESSVIWLENAPKKRTEIRIFSNNILSK